MADQNVHHGTGGTPLAKSKAHRAVANAGVAEPNSVHGRMAPVWAIVRTLLGGTEAMREAGRDLLPQHDYETNGNYKDRLQGSVLDNYTARTLETLVGKAMREPPQPTEDCPEQLTAIMGNVDREGTDLVPFSRTWFECAVKDAVAHVLVDHPSTIKVKEDGTTRTRADDLREGVRPFWRIIPATDMLAMQWERVGGSLELSMVRFRDDELVPDGEWGERLVEQVRVVRPDEWELWEKVEDGKEVKWDLVDIGVNDLGRVPVVSFYTNKTGPGEGRSPLADLAHLNVRHWQSTADQNNILTVARFPMLGASGVSGTDVDQIEVGPKKILTTKNPQGKVYYIEHAGKAIEAGEGDLDRLEGRMASYGAEFLTKTPGNETATGRAIDGAEAISALQGWAHDFRHALEQCVELTAMWLKLDLGDDKTTVVYEIGDDVDLTTDSELNALDKMRARGDISRRAHLTEGKRRGLLPEEYDIDKDREELDAEPPAMGGGGLAGMFGPDGQPVAPKVPGKPEPKQKDEPSVEEPPKE